MGKKDSDTFLYCSSFYINIESISGEFWTFF